MKGGEQASFLVWAPFAKTVEVVLFGPNKDLRPLAPLANGYFAATLDGVGPGTRYKYRLNGEAELPDPASRYQPDGVHGASEVVGDAFEWSDHTWRGGALSDYIFYELHVGAFTPEGTFDAAIEQLEYLSDLGITAVEIMPVAQFRGDRNWGYDGVYPFAVQHSYGGPAGLKRFVDAAHRKGLAVVLDVVYNHLGPEGNYLGQFGPYFTDRYRTPWGPAVDFDGSESAAVRRFVIENALQWVTEFHLDALRLDAVHAIFDGSPRHILQELAETVHERGGELGRGIQVIAESDLNDARLVEAVGEGGYGLDGQWSDDFHHALHSVLTSERAGYYQDFGELRHLAKALGEGFVYSGQFSAFRGCAHGTRSLHLPGQRFVVCSQNHDQIGNRMLGERFSSMLGYEQLKLAAGVLLLSPYLPLLFMGQEYGEPAPFLYFVSHSDPDLIEAVRQGRRREFDAFSWKGEVPDAQAVETFERSRLDHSLRQSGRHRVLLEFYRHLIATRKHVPAFKELSREAADVELSAEAIVMHRRSSSDEALAVLHFGARASDVTVCAAEGRWRKELDSSEQRWMGPGSKIPANLESSGTIRLAMAAHSICVLQRRV
jgi:maltooligosyltrehalose trehalohydrolase